MAVDAVHLLVVPPVTAVCESTGQAKRQQQQEFEANLMPNWGCPLLRAELECTDTLVLDLKLGVSPDKR